MVQVGIFFNGGTNRPLTRSDEGALIADSTVAERHAEASDVLRQGVTQAIDADQQGYHNVSFTEHHFQLGGVEQSTNPVVTQAYIAGQTDELVLRQVANIITWHDPIRLAEQLSILDVLSDGRLEVGIGRGAFPRENEVFGQYWGGTVQDEEINRASFEEKLDILRKAWTEDVFSYHGEFHQVPPSYTRWHHTQDKRYIDERSEYDLEEIIDWDEEFEGSSMFESSSTLKQLSVFPQPQQDPYPQLWQPVLSLRSTAFAARNGINAYLTTGPPSMVKQQTDHYYEAAEAAGWPDRREAYDGEPFGFGWDAERGRGVVTRRPVFLTDEEDEETLERWKESIEFEWAWYQPIGAFTPEQLAGVTDDDRFLEYDAAEHLGYPTDMVLDHDVAYAGTSEEVLEKLCELKRAVGYEDFHVDVEFGGRGLSPEVTHRQQERFAETVLPYLDEEFPTPSIGT